MKHLSPLSGFVLALVFLLRPTLVNAQSDKVDEYIQSEMIRRQIPGLALAVIQDGEIVKIRGYGFANLEHDVPATPDTVFELASLTKQFTATAVMQLVEAGKVKLDDPLSQYLLSLPEAWQSITVRHLLTHTAGLASLKDGFKALYEGGERMNYTTTQMFEAATKDPLSFAPGERWQYSDVGYFLLGMMIEKVSGQRYHDFLAERFFKPFGMTSTSVLDQWAIVKHRAAGYTLRDGQVVNIRRAAQTELPSHYGVFSTVRDLVKWENALASGKILKPTSLEQMWTPVKLNNRSSYPYGFGWAVDERIVYERISHTGITGTEYTRFPDQRLTVIALTNLGQRIGGQEVHAWGLTQEIANHYAPDLRFSSLKEQPGVNQLLPERMQGVLASIAKGEDSPLLTPGLKSALSQERRRAVAAHLKERKSFSFLICKDAAARSIKRNGAGINRVCYFKMVTGSQTRYYIFWLTVDDRIAEYQSLVE